MIDDIGDIVVTAVDSFAIAEGVAAIGKLISEAADNPTSARSFDYDQEGRFMNLEDLNQFIGQNYDNNKFMIESYLSQRGYIGKMIYPTTMIKLDHISNRINIEIDLKGNIEKFWIG